MSTVNLYYCRYKIVIVLVTRVFYQPLVKSYVRTQKDTCISLLEAYVDCVTASVFPDFRERAHLRGLRG